MHVMSKTRKRNGYESFYTSKESSYIDKTLDFDKVYFN